MSTCTTMAAAVFVVVVVAAGATCATAGGPFNVRDYGARGDKKALDSPAIQRALDACREAGGGEVVLPPGDYLAATLRLGSGVTLRVRKGATLWASTDPADYGGGRHAHLLVADDAENVTIVGEGTIHGQGTADYGGHWGAPEKPAFRTGILLFDRCRRVAVRDVTVLYSDAWTLHFRRCEDVAVEGVTIRNNYRRLNSDGIDPNMCRRVRIQGCRITAGDDCIVLKATEDHPTEDVVVTDCDLETSCAAIKLGTESHGDFRDVRFENCRIRNSHVGIAFYLKDGGTMERVRFRDISIETVAGERGSPVPIFMDIERRDEDTKLGRIRDVTFEDIEIRSGSGVLVQGAPEGPIERLTLRDVRFRVDRADDYSRRRKPAGSARRMRGQRETEFARLPACLTFAHVRGLLVEKLAVTVAPEAFEAFDRSAVCGRHIDGGRLVGVTRVPGPEAGERPVVDLQDCQGVEVSPGP